MNKDIEIKNSYLSMNELIYHAAIIGFVAGFINMLYVYFLIFSSNGELLPDGGKFVRLLLIPLFSPVIGALVSAVSALVSYPLYSYFAKKNGGLNISMKQCNDSE